MKKKLRWRILTVLIVAVFSIYTALTKKVNFGLDLQGGSHLVFEVEVNKALKDRVLTASRDAKNVLEKHDIPVISVETSNNQIEITLLDENNIKDGIKILEDEFKNAFQISSKNGKILMKLKESFIREETDRLCEQALETIRNRVDELGVAEPVIVRNNINRIIVELPGIKDPERAKRVIGKVAKLVFKEVVWAGSLKDLLIKLGISTEEIPKDSKKLLSFLNSKVKEDEEVLKGADSSTYYILKRIPILTGQYLKDAYPTRDEYGMPAVGFELNSKGGEIFYNYTKNNIGKRLAIVLDNKVQSAPTIRSAIRSRGQITGNFSFQEARELSIVLRAGALPAPVKLLEETTVGPSLGKESVEKGLKAGIAGFLAVVVFMIIYYKVAGLLAVTALRMHVLILWSFLALLGATLTLPGIAGFILTLGMAVDANVLIFERIKEELRKGRGILPSVESGFSNAWATILDANITTLIASAVLFQFGTGPIKGFAVTLSLGIVSSMFTAVFVSKVLLDILIRYKPLAFRV